MGAADDTAPIELATGRRVPIGSAAPDEDAAQARTREDSSTLAMSVVERVVGLLPAHIASALPQEAKAAIASEATRVVERVWASHVESRAAESHHRGRAPDSPPEQRRTGSPWAWGAGIVGFLLLVGAIVSVASVMSLRMDLLEQRHVVLEQESSRRAHDVDQRMAALGAQIAADAEYNKIVANWLVMHVKTVDSNAKNLDELARRTAEKVRAKVDDIKRPTEEYLPTEVLGVAYGQPK